MKSGLKLCLAGSIKNFLCLLAILVVSSSFVIIFAAFQVIDHLNNSSYLTCLELALGGDVLDQKFPQVIDSISKRVPGRLLVLSTAVFSPGELNLWSGGIPDRPIFRIFSGEADVVTSLTSLPMEAGLVAFSETGKLKGRMPKKPGEAVLANDVVAVLFKSAEKPEAQIGRKFTLEVASDTAVSILNRFFGDINSTIRKKYFEFTLVGVSYPSSQPPILGADRESSFDLREREIPVSELWSIGELGNFAIYPSELVSALKNQYVAAAASLSFRLYAHPNYLDLVQAPDAVHSSQSDASNNELAKLLLDGGKFLVGPAQHPSFLLYFRKVTDLAKVYPLISQFVALYDVPIIGPGYLLRHKLPRISLYWQWANFLNTWLWLLLPAIVFIFLYPLKTRLPKAVKPPHLIKVFNPTTLVSAISQSLLLLLNLILPVLLISYVVTMLANAGVRILENTGLIVRQEEFRIFFFPLALRAVIGLAFVCFLVGLTSLFLGSSVGPSARPSSNE